MKLHLAWLLNLKDLGDSVMGQQPVIEDKSAISKNCKSNKSQFIKVGILNTKVLAKVNVNKQKIYENVVCTSSARTKPSK